MSCVDCAVTLVAGQNASKRQASGQVKAARCHACTERAEQRQLHEAAQAKAERLEAARTAAISAAESPSEPAPVLSDAHEADADEDKARRKRRAARAHAHAIKVAQAQGVIDTLAAELAALTVKVSAQRTDAKGFVSASVQGRM